MTSPRINSPSPSSSPWGLPLAHLSFGKAGSTATDITRPLIYSLGFTDCLLPTIPTCLLAPLHSFASTWAKVRSSSISRTRPPPTFAVMAPRISLLVTTTLSLAALSSADTIQFDIARNPAVRDAQLAKRQLEIQAQGGLWSRGELEQRANTVGVSLTNAEQQGLYFANVSVGTPGQSLALQIDTGSSDIWLPSSTATLCRSVRAGGCPNGQCESFLSCQWGAGDAVECWGSRQKPC